MKDTAYACSSCNSAFRDICIKVFFFWSQIWIVSRTAIGVRDTALSYASCILAFRDIWIKDFFFVFEPYLHSVTNCDWRERHGSFLCVLNQVTRHFVIFGWKSLSYSDSVTNSSQRLILASCFVTFGSKCLSYFDSVTNCDWRSSHDSFLCVV